jgi:hypothetical protein
MIASDAAVVVAALVVLGAIFAVLFYSTSSRVTRLERPSEAEILRRETIGLQACSTGEPRRRTTSAVHAAHRCRAALLEALAVGVAELTPAQRRRLQRDSRRRTRRRRSSPSASGARAPSRPRRTSTPVRHHASQAPSSHSAPAHHHRPSRPSSPSSPAPSPSPSPSPTPPPSSPQPIVTVPAPAVCLRPIVDVGDCPRLTLWPPVVEP